LTTLPLSFCVTLETRRRDGASPSEKRASWSTSGSDGSVAAIVPSPSVVKIPEKVDLKTGEENDKNVLQVHCNLHVFDSKTQSWSERGRGLLRLNDMEHPNDDGTFQSRLVMRTDGSLRLVLNTLLWPQMICEKASQRSLRITALDASDQGIRVFLITCAAKDVQPLHNAIDGRISALKRRHAVLTAQASAVEDPGDESDKCDQHNHDDTSDLSEADSEIMRSDHIRQERMKAVTSVKKGE
jgi:Ran-binding protein 3